MRTTMTIDEDLLRRLRDLAHRTHRSLKDVTNDVLRRGLSSAKGGPTTPFRVEPLKIHLRPGMDPDRMNQLADELDTEVRATKLRRHR
ncbi:MAG: antitoxin [Deltaproteobacteria bacterium]|nr:antitoxin [Deltaproteobacteria bacterium]